MKKDFKAYFIDLDGTLLNTNSSGEKYITKKNLKAVKNAIANEKKIVISTGRLKSFVMPFVKQLGLDFAICGNGSIIIDNKGKIIKEYTIKKDFIKSLNEIIFSKNLAVKMNEKRIAYNSLNSSFKIEMANKLKYSFSKETKIDWDEKNYKIILWGPKEEELFKISNYINSQFSSVHSVIAEKGRTIEITNSKATKGKADIWVSKNLLKIRDYINEIIHIGDTMNDSSAAYMLKYFVAPSNSEKELLKISPYITVSHHDDCIAAVLLGNLKPNNLLK